LRSQTNQFLSSRGRRKDVLSKDGELKVTLFNGTDLFGGEKKQKG
jgi:hypothetical protein